MTQAPPAPYGPPPSQFAAPVPGAAPAYPAAPAYVAPPDYGAPPGYPPPVYGAPPGYPTSGYPPAPGYSGPPGYGPPGYGPPGYGPPGYGPPGYGPPPAYGGPGSNIRIDPVLHQPLSPWWKRLIAIIIDGLILAFAFFVIVLVIAAAVQGVHTTTPQNNAPASGRSVFGAFFVVSLVFSIPAAIYYGAMNGSRRGQTVGKMALGIAVRDARTGAPIGFWRALGRNLITVLFHALLYIPYILDNLAPLWDARRQAWHDKVAHSVVVDLKP